MTSVCFYFEVHQPYRIRQYAADETGPFCFDNGANEAIVRKVADKCYRPATRAIIDLVRQTGGAFRVSFAITGTALDQFAAWTPDVIELFQELAETGACEFVGETSHHSLAFLYSRDEFDAQVAMHRERMQSLFGAKPVVFRNTELMYGNELAAHVARDGRHRAVICEGVDTLLNSRSPNDVYRSPNGHAPSTNLLLKNHRLSDDLAFRFSNKSWPAWPLTAERYVEWIDAINGGGNLCNLFMDYETLGEHQWADSGIFEFLRAFPERLLSYRPGENDFVTVSEAIDRYQPVDVYDVPEMTSWADAERDLSAWLGNDMQRQAAERLWGLEPQVKARHAAGDEYILEDWRKLTTSDHLYYMSTKTMSDGDVHGYFSPWRTPYDAYVHFMNVLDGMRARLA